MSYQKQLSILESDIRRIIHTEYDSWKLKESRTVKEMCDRIIGRIGSSFCTQVLHEKEYKQ